jgi:hypothetical protein
MDTRFREGGGYQFIRDKFPTVFVNEFNYEKFMSDNIWHEKLG